MAALLPKPQMGEMQYDFYMLGRADSKGEAEWDHCMRYTGRKADDLLLCHLSMMAQDAFKPPDVYPMTKMANSSCMVTSSLP